MLVDTDPYPASQCPANAPVTNCLTDAQIQQEIASFVTAQHLPTDLSHEYFLLTPPHVESCFSNNAATNFDGCSAGIVPFRPLAVYCAYHQNTATPTMVFYANMPFDATNIHCQDGNNPKIQMLPAEVQDRASAITPVDERRKVLIVDWRQSPPRLTPSFADRVGVQVRNEVPE